jgi:hypothetical protein
VYGPARRSDGDPGRTWLHAGKLSFDHPDTGERITIESDLPGDLSESLTRLGPPDGGFLLRAATDDGRLTL